MYSHGLCIFARNTIEMVLPSSRASYQEAHDTIFVTGDVHFYLLVKIVLPGFSNVKLTDFCTY